MIALLRIVILAVFSWLFWRLVKGALRATLNRVAATSASSSSASGQVADMICDPVCGSYISMDHATLGDFGGKRLYFCSDDCLKTYRANNPDG